MIKLVNGHFVEFSVVLQNRAQFEKVINVRLAANGGRQGVAVDWVGALEHARKIADAQTEWGAEFPIEKRVAFQEYVNTSWEAECFTANERA